MKGYFLSIAKQSGLRYTARGAQTRTLSDSKRADELTPLEREETVLVTPSMPGNEALQNTKANRADGRLAEEQQASLTNTEQKQEPQVQEQLSFRIAEQRGARIMRNEIKPVYSSGKNSDNSQSIKVEKEIERSHTSRLSVVEPDSPERSVRADGANMPILHHAPIQHAELEEEDPTNQPYTHGEEKKGFFARTAALIEKGEAGAVDMPSILFQEVQEWAAALPLDAGSVHVDAENTGNEISRVAHPIATGVVTVHNSTKPGKAEYIQPMEQNFELSIGTISVIIEEPEKLHQQDQPVQQNNRVANQENGFMFSRLNRSYL